ncbi:hypothetical protein ES703_95708 [subsurface metagenome]
MRLEGKTLQQIRERKILNINERIMDAFKSGLLICTDKRLIMYRSKLFGWNVESMPLEHISSILFNKGLFGSSFIIKTSDGGQRIIFIVFDKTECVKMQEVITNQISIVKASMSGATIPDPDPLMELQLMFVHGEITEEEYFRKMMVL